MNGPESSTSSSTLQQTLKRAISSTAKHRRHSPILPYHKQILKEIASPEEDDFVIMAKGLGMRRVRSLLTAPIDTCRKDKAKHILGRPDTDCHTLVETVRGAEKPGLGRQCNTIGRSGTRRGSFDSWGQETGVAYRRT